MDISEPLKELIKLSPFGGFAIISLVVVYKNSNKSLEKAEKIFDKSLSEIRAAYDASAENSQKLIEIFSDKLGGGGTK